MSYAIFQEVGEALPTLRLTGSETTVLLGIAWFANDKQNREAWPGIDTLATWSGFSESTVYRALKALHDKKILVLKGSRNRFRCRIKPQEEWPQSVRVTDSVGHSDGPSQSERPTQSVTVTDELSRNQVENEVENSPRSRGDRGSVTVIKMRPRQPEKLTATKVANYLLVDTARKARENGRRSLGSHPGGEAAVVAGVKRLHVKDGLEFEEIKALMDLYAISSSAWNQNRHIAADFLDGNTLNYLRNLEPEGSVTATDEPDGFDQTKTLAWRRAHGLD